VIADGEVERAALVAFIAAAGVGEADAEFRALWRARAAQFRAHGLLESAESADRWAEAGRPPTKKKPRCVSPHRLTVEEAQERLAAHDSPSLSAVTADGSQKKSLYWSSPDGPEGDWLVRRLYLAADEDWQTVYQGPSLAEAVRIYNGLS